MKRIISLIIFLIIWRKTFRGLRPFELAFYELIKIGTGGIQKLGTKFYILTARNVQQNRVVIKFYERYQVRLKSLLVIKRLV